MCMTTLHGVSHRHAKSIKNKEKLDLCEKKDKELKDELDKRKLEDAIKKVKDKLDDCEK